MNALYACLAIIALTSQVSVSYGQTADPASNMTFVDDDFDDGSGDDGCGDTAKERAWDMAMLLVFKVWDKNGDKNVDLKEFLSQGPKNFSKPLTAAFKVADADGNNFIDIKEIFVYGMNISSDWILPVKLLVSHVDTNFDLKIGPIEQMKLAKILLKAMLPKVEKGKFYEFQEVVDTLGKLFGLADDQ